MKQTLYIFILLIFIGIASAQDHNYDWVKSVHTSLGVPVDSDTTDDYIIVRPQYVVSYNHTKGVPNWVAWELNSSWYGDVERHTGNFITDKSLPENWQIKHSDYTNSGYDRGHMVRSEERTATEEDNISTFLLTNIIPQRPNLNRKVWLKFEYYCEDLCKEQNKELFVYSGGIYFADSTLKSEGKVAVPESCFKIVVVLEADQSINDITKDTEVIAVLMPNDDEVGANWEDYQTTVDQIESLTGYDFMSSVSDDVENALESASTYIEETEITDLLKVFPNPVQDIAIINLPVGEYKKIKLCDLAGRTYSISNLIISDDSISIDISNLPSGKYFITFDIGKEVYRAEFLKE